MSMQAPAKPSENTGLPQNDWPQEFAATFNLCQVIFAATITKGRHLDSTGT
jgi:hypothetical protein